MSSLLAAVGVHVSLGTLAAVGLSHARNPLAFLSAVRQHRVWPAGLITPLVIGVALIEIALGSVGVVTAGLGFGPPDVLAAACLAAGGVYALYALSTTYLVRERPGTPCGCGPARERANVWTVARSVLLSSAATAGFIGSPHIDGVASESMSAVF
jgi:Methylamine utilisation protein MauE